METIEGCEDIAQDVAAYAEAVDKFAAMDPFDPDLFAHEAKLEQWQARLESRIVVERTRYLTRMIELHSAMPGFDSWFASFVLDHPGADEILLTMNNSKK